MNIYIYIYIYIYYYYYYRYSGLRDRLRVDDVLPLGGALGPRQGDLHTTTNNTMLILYYNIILCQ